MAFNPFNALLRRGSEAEEFYDDDYDQENDYNEYDEPYPQYREEQFAPTMSIEPVKVIKPKKYADRTEIADFILDSRLVVLNLTDIFARDEETAHRIVDFVAGVAYAHEASIIDVTADKQVKVIAPKFVDISKLGIGGMR